MGNREYLEPSPRRQPPAVVLGRHVEGSKKDLALGLFGRRILANEQHIAAQRQSLKHAHPVFQVRAGCGKCDAEEGKDCVHGQHVDDLEDLVLLARHAQVQRVQQDQEVHDDEHENGADAGDDHVELLKGQAADERLHLAWPVSSERFISPAVTRGHALAGMADNGQRPSLEALAASIAGLCLREKDH